MEIANFNEWLIICAPDGQAPQGWTPVTSDIFRRLVFKFKAITTSYSQVVLNDHLYSSYLKKTTDGIIASTSHDIIDYHFINNPIPKASLQWTTRLLNQTVADRYFVIFRTEKNISNGGGDPFFFSNAGLKRICLKIPECSLNRFNQDRKTYWTQDKAVIVRSKNEYIALSPNKQKMADLANNDLILDQNTLISGSIDTEYQKDEKICNLLSIYNGKCVYGFSTSVQTETSPLLKESTRKGNVEFSFYFASPSAKKFYISIWAVHNGMFFR